MKFYSISAIGGEPASIMDMPNDIIAADFSPKAGEIAAVCRCGEDRLGVSLSSPPGTRWRRYKPDPFATTNSYNDTELRFAPDEKQILLLYTGANSEAEAWLLPFPPGVMQPHRTLMQISSEKVLEGASWLPDNRHVVLGLSRGDNNSHLWLADTASSEAYQVTTAMTSEINPGLSPDGKTLAFAKLDINLNVVSVSLVDDTIQTLVGTERNERMPAWAANTEELAYVTDRNGPMEIWVRSGNGSTRPVLTAANFPNSGTQTLMNPTLSPDGSRLIFVRHAPDGTTRNWIMSLAEGVPQRLNEASTDTEFGGTWSPDGRRFAYLQVAGKSMDLAIATVGSTELPIVLRKHVSESLPDWSPREEWISFQDESGWNLISPDGKKVKTLGKISTDHVAFSKDGRQLYGVRVGHAPIVLFSLDLATLKSKNIRELGQDFVPWSDYFPGIRLSVAPDGKSIAFGVADRSSSLWLLDGFQTPGLFQRLFGPASLFIGNRSASAEGLE